MPLLHARPSSEHQNFIWIKLSSVRFPLLSMACWFLLYTYFLAWLHRHAVVVTHQQMSSFLVQRC
jgi:hypothetical protein